MKKSFILLAAVLACTILHAQTADEIVTKHVAAIGGKTAVDATKSLYIESSIEFNGGEGPSTTWIVNGKAMKSESEVAGNKVVQCVTDKGGWTINPFMGATTATVIPDEQLKPLKGSINVGGPLYNYAAKGSKIELLGKDSADYKIKLTNADGIVVTFYINMKTWLIDRAVNINTVQGQDFEVTITYSDYRKLDGGFVLNFAQQVTTPMYSVNLTHKKVEVNKDIDPAIFEMPK